MGFNRHWSGLIEALRTVFHRWVGEHGMEFHPSEMEKMKNDKWLQSVLVSRNGDLGAAVHALILRNVMRKQLDMPTKNCNVKLDKKYSKAVKPVGKDNDGYKVLFLDLTKLCSLSSDKEIREHISYWLERLDRQGNEKITVVLHHGSDKFMERSFELMMMLKDTIFQMYPGFFASLFIFEDFVSHNCQNVLITVFGDEFTFVNGSNWSCHFKLDEKYNLCDGYLKLALKSKAIENDGEKCDKPTVVQCSEDIKPPEPEIRVNVGNKEKEHKKKLKQILTRLHEMENQVFQLITEVQELI